MKGGQFGLTLGLFRAQAQAKDFGWKKLFESYMDSCG
jgi:hypothetical protein